VGVSEEELIRLAIRSLGLSELSCFEPRKRIIEYILEDLEQKNTKKLISMNLREFGNEVASESQAPGGGSVAAYVGSLGISLATMVANLSSHKRGWDDRWEEFSNFAEKGQEIKDKLINLVDEDTKAFQGISKAFNLPKEDKNKQQSILNATKYAIEVPFTVMKLVLESMSIIKEMSIRGNVNSISDVGVGVVCAKAAVIGAFFECEN